MLKEDILFRIDEALRSNNVSESDIDFIRTLMSLSQDDERLIILCNNFDRLMHDHNREYDLGEIFFAACKSIGVNWRYSTEPPR